MDFSIPTWSHLVATARADVRAARSSAAAMLSKTVEYVVATVAAGLVYGLYSKLPRIAKDIVPGPQNSEAALRHHSQMWLRGGPLPASPARLTISGTGTDGTPVAAGTRWQRSDGALYEAMSDVVYGEDDIVVESIALEGEAGYGSDGNCAAGDELTLVDVVVGLGTTWLVDGDVGSTVGDGADVESHENLADRVLQAGANPEGGGKLSDYEMWARAASSAVGNAYAYAGLGGPGTIWIYIVTSDEEDPIPGDPLLEVVEEHVNDEAPAQAGTILYFAPSPVELDPVIELSPNNATTRAAVIEAMEEIIAMRATPGQRGHGGRFRVSWLGEAISGAPGEIDHTLTDPDPSEDIEVGVGELIRLGTPTFSTKT